MGTCQVITVSEHMGGIPHEAPEPKRLKYCGFTDESSTERSRNQELQEERMLHAVEEDAKAYDAEPRPDRAGVGTLSPALPPSRCGSEMSTGRAPDSMCLLPADAPAKPPMPEEKACQSGRPDFGGIAALDPDEPETTRIPAIWRRFSAVSVRQTQIRLVGKNGRSCSPS